MEDVAVRDRRTTTAAGMIGALTKALAEGRLEEKLELYTVPAATASG